MFYLGVFLEQEEGTAQVVAVEKSFYSGSKKYRVVHVQRLHEKNSVCLTRALLEMRHDERWTAVKKVFSQSGRPPKMKVESPLILLSSWDNGAHMADEMRRERASVEVIDGFEADGAPSPAQKADPLDNCHAVSAEMMVSSIKTSILKGNLKPEQLTANAAAPLSFLAEALLAESENIPPLRLSTPWFSALGSCIWHAESIRRIKRY